MLAAVILSLFSIGGATGQTSQQSVHANTRLVQRIAGVDLDRDGRSDTIDLYCSRLDYCDGDFYYDDIRFNLSASGSHAFQSESGWAEFEPAGVAPADVVVDTNSFPKPNILRSRFAYAHVFPVAGTLVFFLGQEPGGSTFAGATVFAITKNGVTKYFEPEEFLLVRFLGPTSDDKRWRMVAGTATAEVFGDESFPRAELTTYCPKTVFVLGKKLAIDERETERLARREYGGYAGPRPREDVMAVRQEKPPRRFLITWPGKKRIEY